MWLDSARRRCGVSHKVVPDGTVVLFAVSAEWQVMPSRVLTRQWAAGSERGSADDDTLESDGIFG